MKLTVKNITFGPFGGKKQRGFEFYILTIDVPMTITTICPQFVSRCFV